MDEADDPDRNPAAGSRSRRARATALWIVVALLAVVVAVLVWPREPNVDHATDTTNPPDTTIDPAAPRSRQRRAAPEPSAPLGATDTSEPAPIVEGTTAVSIEVVTEDGRRCREGTVAFKAPNIQLMKRGMAPLKYLGDASLAAGNPVVLRDLPDSMDELDVEATATVPGLASATAKFTIRVHHLTSVRLAVAPGRTAEVRVLETGSDTPVAGASVVSLTEAERRRADVRALRGSGGAGAARTDAEGSCVVGALGPGDHEFEIDASGYRRASAKWSEGAVTVRLERVKGTGTVTVTVIAPDGRPAPEIVVELMSSDRTSTTGADGRVRFDDVPAGLAFFRFEVPIGDDFDRWIAKVDNGLALIAQVEVTPGGSHEVDLGMRRAAASFEARLVAEDGTPIPDMRVTLFADLNFHRSITDEAGFVRLPAVPASKVMALVEMDARCTWFFGEIEVKSGERATATWTLGSATIRGRIVRGSARTPVSGVVATASGPLTGRAKTDSDGAFSFTRARAGKYRVEVDAESEPGYAAHPIEVTIPTEKETVIELVRCGDVVVRFLPADRATLRGARIVLTPGGEDLPPFRAPDSGDGDLIARCVLPGSYDVVVEVAGRSRSYRVEVKGGATTVVEVAAP